MIVLKTVKLVAAGVVLAAAGAAGTAGALASQEVNVVATTPDLAVLAKAIGGVAVDVKALA